ncbi:hypothetical protein GJ744_008867 [Endocarpon pusillum]|uniref:Uncharacterized protein n=1 Tax=Endocarpon pusillum TaxID=364733 RepID=A0A8H7AQV1_9EURO|nr:hypothetical protein GJ744_008867 [Endocarpon pusillum]
MAPSKSFDAEAALDYLLLLISNSEFKPDFHATAVAAEIASANNAQKKFKKIVEQGGKYKLVKGKVVAADAEEDEDEA